MENAPRTLDIDLIAYGRQAIDEPGLAIPHPRAHQRLFVMGPLAEIAPGWVHPTLGETAAALDAPRLGNPLIAAPPLPPSPLPAFVYAHPGASAHWRCAYGRSLC